MVLLMCLTVFAACVPGLRLWSKTENHVLLGHNVAQVRGVANATDCQIMCEHMSDCWFVMLHVRLIAYHVTYQ